MSGLTKTTYFTLVLLLADGIIGLFRGSSKDGQVKPVVTNVSNDINGYPIYWNVQTSLCREYNIRFEKHLSEFGMIQNPRDDFRGPVIVTLFSPGVLPNIDTTANGSEKWWNGGVPQKGNLEAHLRFFRKTVINVFPEYNFSGLVVIDYHTWQPIYRQNFLTLTRYRNGSKAIVRSEHPDWKDEDVEAEAAKQFEAGARIFLEETMKEAKDLRPLAKWGYKGFPVCYNTGPAPDNAQCSTQIRTENDKLSWLFAAEDVILPTVHLLSTQNLQDQLSTIRGRVAEALRMAEKSNPRKKVFVYFGYKYYNRRSVFLTNEELFNGVWEIIKSGADGIIFRGSSSDFDSKTKCEQFSNYFNATLGPAIVKAKAMPASPNTSLSSTDEVAPKHR